jgi:hypothetical protein
MSTPHTPAPHSASHTAPRPAADSEEIRIISHSTLFYWWIVWAVGFLMALITWLNHDVLAVVPKETSAFSKVNMGKLALTGPKGEPLKGEHDILVTPENKHLRPDDPTKPDAGLEQPHLAISPSKNLGVLFCTVLLIVIFITNVPLRGLWSVIVIFFIISVSIIFALLDWWDPIMRALGQLDIRINLGGYLFISFILFVAWLIVFLLFDQQIYMVFTPGQFRVRLEIGDAETAYDTTGMTIQKQRSDIFRHWILGLGSGDLIIKTSGAQAHTFDMPNVLFLGRKVRQIEELMKSRAVVQGGR